MTTARRNNARKAIFTADALENPFAEGNFRYVAKGKYTIGDRKGQAAVCKWFKTGKVFSEEFFENDITAVNKSLDIIELFNATNIVGMNIKLNIPQVWTFTGETSLRWRGSKTLIEPFVQNYQKFNSNTVS